MEDRITQGEAMGALGMNQTGPRRTTGHGRRSFQRLQGEVKVIQYPDGRRLIVDAGVMAAPGEELKDALTRHRRERVAALFDDAMIPVAFTDWTFGSFPDSRAKVDAFTMAQAYAETGRRENLLLIGATGTGKTGLAIGILKERILAHVPSIFIAVPDLLDKIRGTFDGNGDYSRMMETVKTVDFLVLDDLGSHRATDWATEKVFQIVGYRHDWMLPTVYTSDRTMADLQAVVGRRTLARIMERGTVVEVKGRDLRR